MLAVPITMQVPVVGASFAFTSSISTSSISPARYFAQKRRQSVQAPRRSPLCSPVSMGPVGMMIEGISREAAAINCAGIVLSHPPMSTTASTGCARIISSVSSAIRLRRYMLVGCANDSPIEIVGNTKGIPPSCITPRFTASIICGTLP